MRRVNIPPRVILEVEKTVEAQRQNKNTVWDGRKATVHVQYRFRIFSFSPFRDYRHEAIYKREEDESRELNVKMASA